MTFFTEDNIFIFLVQIFLLLGLARVLGELFRKWKQPALTAEILVGVLLGPTILGRFFPSVYQYVFPANATQHNMLETVAWLGVLFLLLEVGLEIDFSSAWRQRGNALKIALSDVVLPMIIAFVPCLFLPDSYLVDANRRIIFAVFMATVMTISALPITARALHDLKLSKTDLGHLIMSALSVNDIVGWLIFTIVLGIFTQTSFNVSRVFLVFFFTIGFVVFCLTLGKRIIDYFIVKFHSKELPEPATSLTFICLLGVLCGAITQKIGIHALFGFFIAGIMAGSSRSFPERTRQIISQIVYALFVPLFFVNIGLKVDFWNNFDIFLVLLLCVVGVLGRFYGAWFGAGFTKIERVNYLPIAIAHIPGGVMEIVISVLALEYNLITEKIFVAIVFSAVFSSVILGPWLSYAIKKRKKISILEFFSRRAVVAGLLTAKRNEAIRNLCEIASEQESIIDTDTLYSAVLRREDSMGTAMEEEIAVPHARLSFVKNPLIVFGRSLPGIEWNSPDGKSTHFIFLILTPTDDDVQVQILGIIARVMANKDTRESIMHAETSEDLWNILEQSFSAHQIIKRANPKKN